MKKDFSRRDFNRLTAAALGGVVAGAVVGCNSGATDGDGTSDGEGTATEGEGATTEVSYDPAKHACRGLNECKGKGAGGDNECAGQGTCSTVEAHVCGGYNECKYQGGCMADGDVANNECAKKGGCHVPIENADSWARARELFEARMSEAGKEVGAAPAPAEG